MNKEIKKEMNKAIVKEVATLARELKALYSEAIKSNGAMFDCITKGNIYRLIVNEITKDGTVTDVLSTINCAMQYVFGTNNKKGVEPYGIQIKAYDTEEITAYFVYKVTDGKKVEYTRDCKSFTIYRNDYVNSGCCLYADDKDLNNPKKALRVLGIIEDKALATAQSKICKAYDKSVKVIKQRAEKKDKELKQKTVTALKKPPKTTKTAATKKTAEKNKGVKNRKSSKASKTAEKKAVENA